jgi:uroporphyrinogen-III synthase
MKKLYLGLRPKDPAVIHFPLIQIVPRPAAEIKAALDNCYSHILFTSQSAVEIFFNTLKTGVKGKILAVGQETKRKIEEFGCEVEAAPEEESAEGLIKLLETMELSYVLWPRSALSRSLISDYLTTRKVPFCALVLYDTKPHLPGPLPPMEEIGEIIFTSPSTVHAYLHFFKEFPEGKKLTAIGPITQMALERAFSSQWSSSGAHRSAKA